MSPRLRSAPRGAARRLRTKFSGYRHALRRPTPDAELLGAALPALPGAFRRGEAGAFFLAPSEAAPIAAALERAEPGWTERTLADADRLRRRVVRLLGADDLQLGAGPLPWHEDVVNGYRWSPRCFYRAIPIPYGRADIRVPWELSRCQHLPTLGMAFAASGDEAYAQEVVAQLTDWLDANRPGFGVNWSCAMDVAIRAVNWLWALTLIAGAGAVSDPFLTRVLASLVAHARHIEANIERYAGNVTTNHTLADYTGLLYLGAALAALPEAARWAEAGRAGVLECMEAQVLPDGADFENSIPYHRLVLEMFAGSHVLAGRAGRPMPASYAASLERMYEFVAHYTRPDGRAPLVGDADDGRLQVLSRYYDWDPQDHRYLLAVGARLFGRDDLAALAGGSPGAAEEAAWHLGEAAIAPARSPAPAGSRAFAPSGRYVMRSGGHHALVCADEVGTRGMGNHKHNDIFGYELSVDGVAMVVDGGSYLYTSDLAWRDRFRSTRAHSTVAVDGAEQNELQGSFGMRTDARVQIRAWTSDADADVLDASHTGYERLDEPVEHRRTIVFAKDPFAWLVVDRMTGRGRHRFESSLLLAPGAELSHGAAAPPDAVGAAVAALAGRAGVDEPLEPLTGGAVGCARDGAAITIVPINVGPPAAEEGWVAPRYGQRVATTILRFAAEAECPLAFGHLILADGERGWG